MTAARQRRRLKRKVSTLVSGFPSLSPFNLSIGRYARDGQGALHWSWPKVSLDVLKVAALDKQQ